MVKTVECMQKTMEKKHMGFDVPLPVNTIIRFLQGKHTPDQGTEYDKGIT